MTMRIALLIVLGWAAALGLLPADARAQSAGRSAETIYADALAKEKAVQKALTAPGSNRALLKAVRTVVSDFESVVRQYPTSGFCDDALWRAAQISIDAFKRFGESRDRVAAVRLLQAVVTQYPTSRFARQAPARLAGLSVEAPERAAEPQARTPEPPPTPVTAPKQTPAPPRQVPTPRRAEAAAPPPSTAKTPARPVVVEEPASTPASAPLATIKGIRRSVLPDSVRVIIELDREIPFHDERLSNPSRVFVDLLGTKANAALIDQTIRYETDADVVRQIRVGRHANQTTRVVLDADNVTSYSVYPLYSPYRLVIDFLRTAPAVAGARPVTAPPTPAHVPLAVAPAPVRAAAAPVVEAPVAPAPSPASSRPAWARPPVLVARRLPEWTKLPPALTSFLLPELTVPESKTGSSAAPPAKLPATRVAGQAEAAPTPATTVPPSHNLKGGFSIARQLGLGVSRIVIDPGHGGYDSGAKGGGLSEAEVVLDIALRVEKLLAKVPGVEVVLTRRTDTFIPLQERTAIANRESADLFLSIHANASTSPQAGGIETYFLNFATNQTTASVAARENATSGQAMGTLPDVVKTIALNNKLDESRDFATFVQRAVVEKVKGANAGIRDLGVKQAPFVVLIGASMPSVLAEISFLTNPQEAKLLKGQGYRQKIAEALFDAVRKYQAALSSLPRVAQQQE